MLVILNPYLVFLFAYIYLLQTISPSLLVRMAQVVAIMFPIKLFSSLQGMAGAIRMQN